MTTLPPPYTEPGNVLPPPPADAYAPATEPTPTPVIADARAAELIAIGERTEARRDARHKAIRAAAQLGIVGAVLFANGHAIDQLLDTGDTKVEITNDGRTKTTERNTIPVKFVSQTNLSADGKFTKDEDIVGVESFNPTTLWAGVPGLTFAGIYGAARRRMRQR